MTASEKKTTIGFRPKSASHCYPLAVLDCLSVPTGSRPVGAAGLRPASPGEAPHFTVHPESTTLRRVASSFFSSRHKIFCRPLTRADGRVRGSVALAGARSAAPRALCGPIPADPTLGYGSGRKRPSAGLLGACNVLPGAGPASRSRLLDGLPVGARARRLSHYVEDHPSDVRCQVGPSFDDQAKIGVGSRAPLLHSWRTFQVQNCAQWAFRCVVVVFDVTTSRLHKTACL